HQNRGTKKEQTLREIRESQAEKEKTKLARKSLNEYAQSVELPADDDTDKKIEAKMEQIVARKERERKRREERARKAGVAAAEAEKSPKKSDEIEKGPLKVGDKVKIKESDLIGEITQISAKSVSVAIGAITSKMAPSKVERISRQQFKERSRKAASAGYSGPVTDSSQVSYGSADVSSRRLNFSPSIDLRGFRLEEAITAVTHFIDDALMVGVGQVKILHGKGNGILREELRKYLKTMGGVVSMRDEALDQGGAGITVVELD
ncbi:MAG: Smr/MutS family protein, partial [Bacteroidales bacterium]|nr:Smr/MutS family protein [Bacteroidales bacterium]